MCGSRSFIKEIRKIGDEVSKLGHQVILPPSSEGVAPRIKENRELFLRLKPKYMREHLENIQKGDAILVCNFEKEGKNYIGGNTFAEILFAWFLNKKIYFLNPIPEDEHFYEELIAIRPIIIGKRKLEKVLSELHDKDV